MESCFNLFGDSVSLGARLVHGLRIMHHRLKPLWKHQIIIVREEAHVEGRFDLFGDSANLDARQVYGLHGTYHILGNQFGRIR